MNPTSKLEISGIHLHAETGNDVFTEQLFQKTNMMVPFCAQLHSIPLWWFGQKVALTRVFVRFTAQKKTCFFALNQLSHRSRQTLIATAKKHAGKTIKTLTKY